MKRIVTQSELSTFKLCRFKHYLKYEKKYGRPGKSISAATGNAGHAGLEMRYKTNSHEDVPAAAKDVFDQFSLDQAVPLSLVDKFVKAREMVPKILDHYADFYKNDSLVAATDPFSKRLMVEHEFRIPVITNGGRASRFFNLAGKIDLVASLDNALWIVDHKFKAIIDDSLENLLRISFQMRTYVYAMRIYLGLPIKGVCLNVVLRQAPGKPKINKNGTVSLSKVNTTFDIYMKTLHDQDAWLRNNGKAGIDFTKYEDEIDRIRSIKWFARYFYEYSNEELMEIQREVYMITSAIHQCQALGPWAYFKNDLACNIFGKCTYSSICQGISTDENFSHIEDPHSELEGLEIHKVLGKGFAINDGLDLNEPMTFEDAFDAVL